MGVIEVELPNTSLNLKNAVILEAIVNQSSKHRGNIVKHIVKMANVDALKHATQSCDLSTTMCPCFTAELSLENCFQNKRGKKKLIGLLTRFHPKRLVRSWISILQVNDTTVNKSRMHTNRIQLFVRQHKQSRERAHMVIFKSSDVRQSRY